MTVELSDVLSMVDELRLSRLSSAGLGEMILECERRLQMQPDGCAQREAYVANVRVVVAADSGDSFGALLLREKGKRAEAEHEELMKNPEVREKVRQMAEDYYHKDWLTKPVPAFDGLTPIEAVKTLEGRQKVEEFLDELEIMQHRNIDEAFQVDVNGLRKRLGIATTRP